MTTCAVTIVAAAVRTAGRLNGRPPVGSRIGRIRGVATATSSARMRRGSKPLDITDWRILDALQRDGRLSYNQLARRVNLSAPAVAERVRRLEEQGVIAGYQARVDPAKAGLPLTAFIQMRCTPGRCLLQTSSADDLPEVVEVHKLSGEWCSMLKVRVASMQHLEGLFERIGERHGRMNTHVVLSTQFDGRPVEPPAEQARPVTPSPGWHRA